MKNIYFAVIGYSVHRSQIRLLIVFLRSLFLPIVFFGAEGSVWLKLLREELNRQLLFGELVFSPLIMSIFASRILRPSLEPTF